jgi:small subunit ribosomal protein S27e
LKKEQVLIPLPRSAFLLVKCPSCGAERVIFSHAKTVVKCPSCGAELAKPTGGRAQILGEIVRRLD